MGFDAITDRPVCTDATNGIEGKLEADSGGASAATPARTIRAGLAGDIACDPRSLATDTPHIMELHNAEIELRAIPRGADEVPYKLEAVYNARAKLLKDVKTDADELSCARGQLVKDTGSPKMRDDLDQVNGAKAKLDRDVRASLLGPEVEDRYADDHARRLVQASYNNSDVANSVWGQLAVIKATRTPADYAQMLIDRSFHEIGHGGSEHDHLVKIAENYSKPHDPAIREAVLKSSEFQKIVDRDVDYRIGSGLESLSSNRNNPNPNDMLNYVWLQAKQIKEPAIVVSYVKSTMRYVKNGPLTNSDFNKMQIDALENFMRGPDGKVLPEGQGLISKLRSLLKTAA